MLRLLTNPIFMRMAGAFLVGVFVMLLFVWFVRRLRSKITDEGAIERTSAESSAANFTLAAYQGVIQKFKEQ